MVMRTHRYFLLIFLLLVTAGNAIANVSVSGKVIDAKSGGIGSANVILLHAADSTLAKADIANDDGTFKIEDIAVGIYILKVALIGYNTYSSEKIIIADKDITLPVITLLASGTDLKEVSVRGQKPFIEIHADKIVVNVENSIVNAGSSAMDVLTRSPGVTVDQNDKISLKGKQGVTIMIDGKITPIAGADLANLLKSMPSNSIESIELISNPSAKYDAAGTASIINIKLKKDKKIGLNGSVNGTYGQGVYPKSNLGFNLNYRNKKFNIFASYNYAYRKGFNHLTLTRNFYNNSNFAGAYDQDDHFLFPIVSHTANAGMDYNVSSKTTIGFVVSGNSTHFDPTGTNFTNVVDSATRRIDSFFTTTNNSHDQLSNYAANVNLRHTFDSSGQQLSVDADYARYTNSSTQNYTTNYYNYMPDGTSIASPSQPPYILLGQLSGITQIRSLKADYENPLKNNAKLEAGIKTSFVTSDNEPAFYNKTDTGYVLDKTKSDHFIYNENINAAYINFSKDWPKWSTQIGLRGEQTIATGDEKATDSTFSRNYFQLFPSLAVQWHVDANNDLGITLSRRIERPSYDQLNPFKYFLDPTTYKAGYPYLNPALSYSAELSYTYKQKFITTFNYTITNDPITEVIQPSETENRVTIQTTKNLTSMAYYGISGAYQLQFFKWWSNTTNFNAYYSQYKGDLAGTTLNNGRATFDVNTSNSFILPKNFSAELSFFYQAPMTYGYMYVRPSWMLNAGVQKNLFDKRATIRLNCTDIFWRGWPSGTSYYNNYVESFVAKRDTRQLSLSFTYRFGKRSVGQVNKHNGGAEDEKRRVGGAG